MPNLKSSNTNNFELLVFEVEQEIFMIYENQILNGHNSQTIRATALWFDMFGYIDL